jgi:SAM-dependent methyltransferase
MEDSAKASAPVTEKSWHDALYESRADRSFVVPAEIRNRYLDPPQTPLFHLEAMFRLVGDVAGKDVLCIGCGDSNTPVLLALKGARVWAFDLSREAMRLQRRMAQANGVGACVQMVVCSADRLPFRAGAFDVGFGSAILHHLPDHLAEHARELSRVLRASGFALFEEPVSRSRVLRWLRSLFPASQFVSPLERPLRDEDFAAFRRYFDMRFFPFHGLARLDDLTLRGPMEFAAGWRRRAVYAFHWLDSILLRLPGLDRFAGINVFVLRSRSQTS